MERNGCPMENKEVNSWTKNQQRQETILEPTSLDILYGRDHRSVGHIGNRCFRALVCVSLEKYKSSSTLTEKNEFLNAIVKSILISGGRFLRRQSDDRGWEQVNLRGAKDKVCHAFRDGVMKSKRPKRLKRGVSSLIKRHCNSADHFLDWKDLVRDMMNAESAGRISLHESIHEPTDLDILHGRDDFSLHHLGNICFHRVIDYSVEQYRLLSTRAEKGKLFSAIVSTIHHSGGRFLQRQLHDDGWEQDDADKAKQTVGQALRDVIKKPTLLSGSLLIHESNLSFYYKTAYDFDWRGMVDTAQHLQSEAKIYDAGANADANLEDNVTVSSISDISVNCLLSDDDISLSDYQDTVSL